MSLHEYIARQRKHDELYAAMLAAGWQMLGSREQPEGEEITFRRRPTPEFPEPLTWTVTGLDVDDILERFLQRLNQDDQSAT